MQARKHIAQTQDLIETHRQNKNEYKLLLDELNHLKHNLQHHKTLKDQNSNKINHLEDKLTLQQKNIVLFKSQLNFFKLLFWKFFKNDPLILQLKTVEKEIRQTIIEISELNMNIPTLESAYEDAKKKYNAHELICKEKEKILYETEEKIKVLKFQFKDNWVDDKNAQKACPWTYEEYNKLREELFYQALMLNKAFVLSSNHTRTNLECLFKLWDGRLLTVDKNMSYASLLNTLLLVIPVISTTFASVQNFLDAINAEEIGILVVDEAGQATPQSALGALWRTKKAIIVGDPLQVEPIVTIPNELKVRLANENSISPIYRLSEISVQTLADQLNHYGGLRTLKDKSFWLGCPLVIHRRCLNPMFQISNEIAYNNRMFLDTPQPNPTLALSLSNSIWFNIKGTEAGNKNHSVKQQTDKLVELVLNAIHIYKGLPELYIITPFTSVANAIRSALLPIIKNELPELENLSIKNWLQTNCGTIHTFQGKEANEVILVLGCDKHGGKSAAHWVGMKPNIINVAVSRAKYRLGVIGDYDLWKDIPYVQILCKYLLIQ